MTRPFRFIAPMPRLDQPGPQWRAAISRIEDQGYTTVSVSDHFTQGWVMDPVVAMAVATEVTERLRVLSLVLGNDYRHPVMVHKAMATLDVLSEGRVEIGLGAGWLQSDYQAAGIAMDPAAARIERLEEASQVLKGLFAPRPLTFSGRHYRIRELDGLPKPVQRPRPPILIGGGGRRLLGVAGRQADIVSINPSMPSGLATPSILHEATSERIEQKITWVREAAQDADRSSDEIELQLSLLLCRVETSSPRASQWMSSLVSGSGADPATLRRSPAVLVGSVEECVESLEAYREQFGISYLNVGDSEAAAPIVHRLAGA